jgi:hypothetical protein
MKSNRWIKYILVLFVIIAVYKGNIGSIKDYANTFSRSVKSVTTTSKQNFIPEADIKEDITLKPPLKVEPGNKNSVVSNFTANVLNKVLENPKGRLIFEEVINRMSENYHGTLGEDLAHKEFIAKDLTIGKGMVAECGDKVSISYSTQNPANKRENLLVTKNVYLGTQSLGKFLENGIIGMKQDGNRKIIYVDKETSIHNKQNKKKDFITADVTLNKITKLHRQNNWGIFVDKESFSLIGTKIMCGDEITSSYKIRNLEDGKLIYDSKDRNKPISFNIGSHKTPDKITKGLVGLVKEKSKISIVDKASNLDYTDKNGNKLIPQGLESNNLFLVEIDTKP